MSTSEAQPKVHVTVEGQHTVPGQHPVPPAGEEIHLPGGSALPLLVAVGVTLLVVGTTIWWVWSLCGFILTAICVGLWIRDTRREVAHLPDDLDAGH